MLEACVLTLPILSKASMFSKVWRHFNYCADTTLCLFLTEQRLFQPSELLSSKMFLLPDLWRDYNQETQSTKPKLQASTREDDKCVLIIAVRRAAADESASSIVRKKSRNPTATLWWCINWRSTIREESVWSPGGVPVVLLLILLLLFSGQPVTVSNDLNSPPAETLKRCVIWNIQRGVFSPGWSPSS